METLKDRINYYCTFFDSYYYSQFLCLNKSLKENDKNSIIIAFCLDNESYDLLKLKNLDSVEIFSMNDLEKFEPKLQKVKNTRTKVEYYFTLSPQICRFALSKFPQISAITYLDADLFFFQSPAILFDELGENSISIIPHNNWGIGKILFNKYGLYNVGWITFKDDNDGNECLNEWADDCIEWCYDKFEDGKFADQKYLEKWPQKYKCKVIQNKGANLAPWNIGRYNISVKENTVYVDDDKLVFYHFASLFQIEANKFKTNLSKYFTSLSPNIVDNIYTPYLILLLKEKKKKNVSIRATNKFNNFKGFMQYILRGVKNYFFNDIVEIHLK